MSLKSHCSFVFSIKASFEKEGRKMKNVSALLTMEEWVLPDTTSTTQKQKERKKHQRTGKLLRSKINITHCHFFLVSTRGKLESESSSGLVQDQRAGGGRKSWDWKLSLKRPTWFLNLLPKFLLADPGFVVLWKSSRELTGLFFLSLPPLRSSLINIGKINPNNFFLRTFSVLIEYVLQILSVIDCCLEKIGKKRW